MLHTEAPQYSLIACEYTQAFYFITNYKKYFMAKAHLANNLGKQAISIDFNLENKRS